MRTKKTTMGLMAIVPALILLLSISCKSDKNENDSTTEDTEQANAGIDISDETNVAREYHEVVQSFIECKSTATERSQCRNEITRLISETHNLEEFKDSEQNYVIYDSIQPIVKRSDKWKNIGTATNQEVLNKAIAHANNGGAALIIDTSETYGHVVMLKPGEAYPSGSWNMELPNVMSLFNAKPENSFYDKSLSFAFKKSDDLQVYLRN